MFLHFFRIQLFFQVLLTFPGSAGRNTGPFLVGSLGAPLVKELSCLQLLVGLALVFFLAFAFAPSR